MKKLVNTRLATRLTLRQSSRQLRQDRRRARVWCRLAACFYRTESRA